MTPDICIRPGCERWVPRLAGGKLCSSDVLPLAMLCYGKARRGRDSAARELKRRGRTTNHMYTCPLCSMWHIGQYVPERRHLVQEGWAKAELIIAELRAAGYGWYLGQLAEDWHPSRAHRDPERNWRSRLTA